MSRIENLLNAAADTLEQAAPYIVLSSFFGFLVTIARRHWRRALFNSLCSICIGFAVFMAVDGSDLHVYYRVVISCAFGGIAPDIIYALSQIGKSLAADPIGTLSELIHGNLAKARAKYQEKNK